MNTHTDENGVKYVLAVSHPNKKVSLKRVNLSDIPAAAMGRIIRCKQISSMQPGQEQTTKPDDVELTVVSTTADNNLIVNNPLNKNGKEDTDTAVPPKKIRTEVVTRESTENDTALVSPKAIQKETLRVATDEYDDGDDEDEDDFDDEDEDEYDQIYSTNAQMRNIGRTSTKDDSYDYVPPSSGYKAKRTQSETEKRKVKPKLFRSEWLNIDIFRDWLDRDPTNPYKARCVACDSVINAGKSELEKHAAGMKHSRAVERMQQELMLNQLVVTEGGDDSNEEIRHMEGSSEHTATQSMMLGEGAPTDSYIRVQHVEALNRVAAAVETLSAATVAVLDKMSTNQESLIQILQQLHNK